MSLEYNPSHKTFQTQLKKTLKKIQFAARFTEKQFCSLLEVTEDDFEKFCLGQKELSLKNLDALSKNISLSIDLIFSGKIDYRALANQLSISPTILPERYQTPEHQIALKRSLLVVFDYMNRIHGKHHSASLLKRIQVDPHFIITTGDFVSPLLQADYFGVLEREGIGLSTVRDMGINSIALLRPGFQKIGFDPRIQVSTLYELFLSRQILSSDLCFDYSISNLQNNACTFEIVPNLEYSQRFENEIEQFHFSCQFKIGMISALPQLVGIPNAKFREIRCWFKGHSSCRFELDW